MIFLGYIGFAIMGMIMGLVGAGGSIMTIPILLYCFKIPLLQATSYSLALVGTSSLIGSMHHRHKIDHQNAILLCLPAMIGTWLSRLMLLPNLPQHIGTLPLEQCLLYLLVLFLLTSGFMMIRPSPPPIHQITHQHLIIPLGLMMGILLGLLGAGGGFLIIPTLVFFMGYDMKTAVPTSLFIIAMNSFVGFIADQQSFSMQQWLQLITFLIPAIIGMILGTHITKHINRYHLKTFLGLVLWLIAAFIIAESWLSL